MLSRTADNLYWMARHMERAENIARLLNAQHQASMLLQPKLSSYRQWQAVIDLFELEMQFISSKKSSFQIDVLNFMVLEETNESSIFSCLKRARENALTIRGGLPTELWEVINSIWLEFPNIFKSNRWLKDLENSLEWVKQYSHTFRGVLEGTMPRNEFLYFTKLGMFLERADNTARILDINFLLNYSSSKKNGSSNKENLNLFKEYNDRHDLLNKDNVRNDYYFWVSVLRSLSAGEIYSMVYRDEMIPKRIAELLIYREDMPRSLIVCVQNIQKNLTRVSKIEQKNSKSIRIVGKLCAEIKYEVIDDDFVYYIHDFLESFLERINYLGGEISNEYLVPVASSENNSESFLRVIDD